VKIPCIDISTGLLLLKYDSKDEATFEKNEQWSILKVSWNERFCAECQSWHLFDAQGLGRTGNQRLTYRQTRLRVQVGNLKGKRKCASCISSHGGAKTIFTDLKEAQSVIDSLTVLLEQPLWAYKCPQGPGIHLTKNAHLQSIGLVQQKYSVETEYKIVEVNRPLKISASVPKPNLEASNLHAKRTTRIVCESCGYKGNQDATLKCAWCEKLGPYATIKDPN